MKQTIYLDHAAATPVDEQVFTVMQPYYALQFYNPSATYLSAQQVRADIDTARQRIAYWLGARPSEIIFTAGGTEANNMAIKGIMEMYPDANIIVSSIEHESVLVPAHLYNTTEAPVSREGMVVLDKLKRLVSDDTVLISIMYANNEVGTVQPIKQISALIKQVRLDRQKRGITLPIYFHTDACQAVAYLDIHASRLGVDMMTLNGGKIYGPKQSGVLYVRSGTELEPFIHGGGQESGKRSGTENVAGIIGLAAAIDLVQARRKNESVRLSMLQKQFTADLHKKIPNCLINGSMKSRLPNNIHVTFPGSDNERLIMELDERGIQCAAGSACSASNEEPSHVLRAMGMTEEDAQASIRFTMGTSTTSNALQKTLAVLIEILPSVRI